MRNATLTWNLLLFVPACAFAGLPLTISGQTKGETDQREIEGRMLVDAWNRHDAKAFAAVFAEDADFTNWRGTGVSGRSNIEEFHAPMFATIFKNSHQSHRAIKTFVPPSRPCGRGRTLGNDRATDAQGNPRPFRQGFAEL
jgi:hypothetical protein